MRLPLILAAWAFALTAHAATLPATPATMTAVLAKAQPGDTLALGARAALTASPTSSTSRLSATPCWFRTSRASC